MLHCLLTCVILLAVTDVADTKDEGDKASTISIPDTMSFVVSDAVFPTIFSYAAYLQSTVLFAAVLCKETKYWSSNATYKLMYFQSPTEAKTREIKALKEIQTPCNLCDIY
jgi:hypothetical protein